MDNVCSMLENVRSVVNEGAELRPKRSSGQPNDLVRSRPLADSHFSLKRKFNLEKVAMYF